MLDPNLDIYSLEGKKDFVRSLVAYNIVLEGFGSIQALWLV